MCVVVLYDQTPLLASPSVHLPISLAKGIPTRIVQIHAHFTFNEL